MKPKTEKAKPRGISIFTRFFWPIFFILCLTASSCRQHNGKENLLPRPQPGYTAWLEKQSMAARADKLIAQVSQTDRVWMFSGKGAPVDVLLEAAPQWLELTSAQFPGQIFLNKINSDFSLLEQSGVKGLYLGPLGEDQSYWRAEDKSSSPMKPLPASLDLDPRLGDEKALIDLAEQAEKAGMELGADLLAANTSMGPDFFLQARNAPGHAGLYAMLELPKNLWVEAPVSSSEWDVIALSENQIKSFSSQGVLPRSLFRDKRAWGDPAGWAVTGEVMGTDGKPRRWLYRFEGEPKFPVFIWQDPSALARKVLSGAVIQNTGFWRLPLVGLRLSALMGLEPDSASSDEPDDIQSASPGLEALDTLSTYIHRYGGWALQADPVPMAIVEAALAGNCDFCREDLTENLVIEAIESENPTKLTALYKRWLKLELDQKRLARGFNAWDRFSSYEKRIFDKKKSDPDSSDFFAKEALLSWRLGLPGLAFLNPEEMGLFSRKEIGSDEIKALKNILFLRAKLSLAKGKLIKVNEAKNSVALLSALPQKGYWLLATNFSRSKDKISISLPEKCSAVADVGLGEDLSRYLSDSGRSFTIPLDGREARHVIFYLE